MTARQALIEDVFEEALDVPVDRRAPWLAKRCGSDDTLRREVEAMLASFERPNALLDGSAAPIAALAARILDAPLTDRRIGPYRVIRELGRGGMGVVYLAERDDGHFQRHVAVKLLLATPDADELRRRLIAERQILASLSHPNIAQLFDGGVAQGQLPYLVLEYVDGAPITTHCERANLDIAARLRLFLDVCAAVHHAHANLILHRDLKPGNILVTSDGQVKLLDFGIAKLLGPATGNADATVTLAARRPMTPAYASPEQVRGDVLTTASDVYSLGLVLYELLTGLRANEIESESPQDAMRRIIETETPRPSTRATQRARELKGDLDAIVMMALRKEPRSRYGSVELLSADITRHLEGFRVLAHRGTATYRIGKALRRHRTAVAGAALVALTLAGGSTAALWQARIAGRERSRATVALAQTETALAESQESAAFLVSLFEASDMSEGRPDALRTSDLLRRGAARAERMASEPLAQARMFDALASVKLTLGDVRGAREDAMRALERRERMLGTRNPSTANSWAFLANIERRAGAYPRADSLARLALEARLAVMDSISAPVAASLEQLTALAVYLDQLPRADSLIERAVFIHRALRTVPDSDLANSIATLSSIRRYRGQLASSTDALREAIAVAGAAGPAARSLHASLRMRLSDQLSALRGHDDEAIREARGALDEMRALFGPAHANTANLMRDLAICLTNIRGARGAVEAEGLLREARAIETRTLPPTDPTPTFTLHALAETLRLQHRLDEAAQVQREAIALGLRAWGPAHSAYAGLLYGMIDIEIERGALDSAEDFARRAIAIRVSAIGAGSAMVAITNTGLARVEAARGRYAAADSLFRAARNVIEVRAGAASPDLRPINAALAALHARWGHPDLAAYYRHLLD